MKIWYGASILLMLTTQTSASEHQPRPLTIIRTWYPESSVIYGTSTLTAMFTFQGSHFSGYTRDLNDPTNTLIPMPSHKARFLFFILRCLWLKQRNSQQPVQV